MRTRRARRSRPPPYYRPPPETPEDEDIELLRTGRAVVEMLTGKPDMIASDPQADLVYREFSLAVRMLERRVANALNDPAPVALAVAEDGKPLAPAVPIHQSVTPDHIVCLEDGRKFKSLKRHLRTRYDLSPEDYRARWGLPADYPMVAPNYAKAREDLARQMGLVR